MHTQFQEIIHKFLKSTLLAVKDKYEQSSESPPPKAANINQTLISYNTHITLYKSLINYLDSESLLLNKNYESGQITNPHDLSEILKKISFLNEQANQFITLIDLLNLEFSTLIANREFLNLQSPSFSDFEHFAKSTEFNVFFLNDDYTRDFTNTPRYRRLNLNKNDFENLELIYQVASTPKDFLLTFQQSLNLGNEKKIALCNYEPRHNGFLVYFDPSLKEISTVFERLSRSSPNGIYRLNDSDSWIINTLEYNFETQEILECFDVWLDTNWLTIYLQVSLFPIHKLINPFSQTTITHSCHHGSFLDNLDTPTNLNKEALLSTLTKSNPYWYLQKILIHDGHDFFELENDAVLCQTNIILIKFFNGESDGFIAYYNVVDNKLMLHTQLGGTEADLLTHIYLLGLAIKLNQSIVVA